LWDAESERSELAEPFYGLTEPICYLSI
jgi:hypothetical protein